MKKILIGLIIIFGIVGCVTTELSTKNTSYDTNKQARIRLYGQNGKVTEMTVNLNGKKETITVGGGMGQAFSSMLGVKGNESIGILASEFSKNFKQYSKFASGIFFKEFIIPTGETTVEAVVLPLTNISDNPYNNIRTVTTLKGCSGNKLTFEAKAGTDYEVIPFNNGSNCDVSVQELK